MRVSDLAKEAGTSVQSVYRAVKRLGKRLEGKVSKVNGVSEVSDEGAAIVREALKVSAGATIVKPTPPEVTPPAPAVDLSPLSGRLESMEKALLAVAEELRATRQEVSTLRGENAALRVMLLPAPSKPAPVWKSEPARPDPREMNFFQRIFCELFAPDKLRRFAS